MINNDCWIVHESMPFRIVSFAHQENGCVWFVQELRLGRWGNHQSAIYDGPFFNRELAMYCLDAMHEHNDLMIAQMQSRLSTLIESPVKPIMLEFADDQKPTTRKRKRVQK